MGTEVGGLVLGGREVAEDVVEAVLVEPPAGHLEVVVALPVAPSAGASAVEKWQWGFASS